MKRFASVPLAWMQETGVSHDKLNVNGGAIALVIHWAPVVHA